MTDNVNRAHGPADHARLLTEWREAVANATAAMEASNAVPPDADLERADRQACERVRQLAREAWATPVSGPGELRLRAEIARHALWTYDDGMRRFEAVLAGEDAKDGLELGHFGERAVAELVRAILWTPGAAEPARDVLALPEPAALELDESLAKARQGLTTLRTVVQGWERQHGPHKLIDEDDAAFLASLDFCADGIESTIDLISNRIAAAAGWESD